MALKAIIHKENSDKLLNILPAEGLLLKMIFELFEFKNEFVREAVVDLFETIC